MLTDPRAARSLPAVLAVSFVAITATVVPGCAQPRVRPIDLETLRQTPEILTEGVLFALPRTVVTIDLPVRRIETRPSPFLRDVLHSAEEMRDYLSATDFSTSSEDPVYIDQVAEQVRDPLAEAGFQQLAIRLNRLGIPLDGDGGVRFELGTPGIRTHVEPDPERLYTIDIAPSPFTRGALSLDFTETGTLSFADSEFEDRTIDLTIKTLEVAGRIAAITAGGKWTIAGLADNPYHKILKHAGEVLDDLEELRGQRRTLLGSGGDASRGALELRLKALAREERSLVSYFHDTETAVWNASYTVRPRDGNATTNRNILLFELHPNAGLHRSAGFRGQARGGAIPPRFAGKLEGAPLTISFVRDLADGENRAYDELDRVPKPRTAHGFPYRLPAPASAVLKLGGTEIARSSVTVAQLGALAFLPTGPGAVEETTRVDYHPRTGALRRLRMTHAGIDPQSIERLGDAVVPLLENSAELQARTSALLERLEELIGGDELDQLRELIDQ